MSMPYAFSLAYLTVPDVTPEAAIAIAYQAGYQKLSLRLLPATPVEPDYPLLKDSKRARVVKTMLDDHGMGLGEIELIWLTPSMDANDFRPLFERITFLGGKDVVVLAKDNDMARMVAHLALLAEMANTYGLHLQLEAIPWTGLHRIEDAISIIRQVNLPNLHLLVDSLHIHRMASTAVLALQTVSPLVTHMQLCDATRHFQATEFTDLRNEAKTGRLFPGDGELPLLSLLQLCASDITLSLEIPNAHYLTRYTPLERAQLAIQKTKALLSL